MSDSDNNPHKLREAQFIAHMGFFRNFGTYLASYERGVELLYGQVAVGAETPESVAPPLLFLMRHSLELGYKFTLVELYCLREERYDAERFSHHFLSGVHRELKVHFDLVAAKYSISQSIRDSFNEYYERTRIGMEFFDKLDKNSIAFRYPIDKSGKLVFSYDKTIDLLSLKCVFDEAMVLLRHTVDVLSPCHEILQESRGQVGWCG